MHLHSSPRIARERKLILYDRSWNLLITLLSLLTIALFLPWIVGALSKISQLLGLTGPFSLGPLTSLAQNVIFLLGIATYLLFRTALYKFTEEPFGASSTCPQCGYALRGLQLQDPLQATVNCPECQAHCQLLPSELLPRLFGDPADLAELQRATADWSTLNNRYWKLLNIAMWICGAISLVAMILDLLLVLGLFQSSSWAPVISRIEPLVKDVIRPLTMFSIVGLSFWFLPAIRAAQWRERQLFLRLIAARKLHPMSENEG